MKFRLGDRVRFKTWEEMLLEWRDHVSSRGRGDNIVLPGSVVNKYVLSHRWGQSVMIARGRVVQGIYNVYELTDETNDGAYSEELFVLEASYEDIEGKIKREIYGLSMQV